MAAQGRNFDFLDVDAVDQNLPLLNVVVPADQGQDRALAGAGSAYEGNGLLWQHMEADALQHPLPGLVGKPHILKFDLTLNLVQFDSIRLVHHFRNHVQNGEDLLRRGEGPLERIKLLRQGLDGVEELGDIHVERHDNPAGDGLTHNGGIPNAALGAEIKQAQHRGHIQHVHHGTEDAEDESPGLLGPLELPALFQEVGHLPVLLVEDLGDLDAGKVLGQVGINVRGGVVDAAVDLPGELLEDHGEQHHKGHEAQHHQRQNVVQHQHGSKNADEHHHILHQCYQDVGKHIRDGVGVVGGTGHQLAHGNVVQLGMAQALDVGEDVLPDLGQNFLAGLLQDHSLEIGTDQADDQNPRVHRHPDIQVPQCKILLHQHLDVTDEQRRHQIVDDGQQHDEEGQQKVLPVGFRVMKQAADDLGI